MRIIFGLARVGFGLQLGLGCSYFRLGLSNDSDSCSFRFSDSLFSDGGRVAAQVEVALRLVQVRPGIWFELFLDWLEHTFVHDCNVDKPTLLSCINSCLV